MRLAFQGTINRSWWMEACIANRHNIKLRYIVIHDPEECDSREKLINKLESKVYMETRVKLW
uniref:Uncharacterized protein n=1 Tax=Oryza brachyantha TaxID=4533 RepID=J3MUT1_ORYBR